MRNDLLFLVTYIVAGVVVVIDIIVAIFTWLNIDGFYKEGVLTNNIPLLIALIIVNLIAVSLGIASLLYNHKHKK
ncbi:MAG: hypothetical protein FWD32_02815 [Firmicutes bacterium]|nr:hypothetical protein [Bacillota bacterium]